MQTTAVMLGSVILGCAAGGSEVISSDLCIYGGTAAGVVAGVQAARMGKTAVIVEPGVHLGGMTSGGLGATDIGNKKAIGGISREFYQRIARHYAEPDNWPLEAMDHFFGARGPRDKLEELKTAGGTMWTFEPHVAERILFEMVNEARVPIYFRQRLTSVEKSGGRITGIRTEGGKVFRAKIYIDASYEGDLMAKAGVGYVVGREANSAYSETLNGIRVETPKHQFEVAVDPYRKPGDPQSGLIGLVGPGVPAVKDGEPDHSVQAYNFRLCYTQNPSNRLAHVAPANYTPERYELLARYLAALVSTGRKPKLGDLWHPVPMPNGKTDINNNGPVSTDYIGANYEYPEADYAGREQIWRDHADYMRGFIYFLATDSRVPENVRQEMQTWGPAKDEFADTENWPHQLYVREARRMVSAYVMSEHNCRGTVCAEDSIGLAAYTMDSHNCRRLARRGRAENEGDVQAGGFPPYPISYQALVPKGSECENLLVPICLSATHIAYGSIRMEPVFMILGESAATAGVLAIEGGVPVQQVSYGKLRAQLLRDHQVLEWQAR